MQILINVILQMKTTKQIYQNRWFHTILNNKTTIYEKKQTHTFVPRTSAAVGISLSFISQLQSLEFFQSPEWDVCRNSTRLSNRFLFNSSCSRYKENTKLHKLFLAVICYIFPNLRKKTIIISIPKITCKMIIRWNLNFFSLNIQWISSVWDSFL